jgi:hypothetical protein
MYKVQQIQSSNPKSVLHVTQYQYLELLLNKQTAVRLLLVELLIGQLCLCEVTTISPLS